MQGFLNNWETFEFFGLIGIPAIIAVLVIASAVITLALGFLSAAIKLVFIFLLLTIISNIGIFDIITDFFNGTTSEHL